jgi:2-methylisocitrate lyase-like PEP mutase family enzyme
VLADRGFKIVIFPGGTVRALVHHMQAYFSSLQAHQTTQAFTERMLDFDGLNAVIETPQLLELGKKYDA